jgi:hypothetical protein
VAATAVGHACGRSACKPCCAIGWDSRSPCVTSRRAPQMEPDRAPSVQLHQWQLRRHAGAHLGVVSGGHSWHHHQGWPDRTGGAPLRQVSDRLDGHQRLHADAQPGTASYLSGLELHTPSASNPPAHRPQHRKWFFLRPSAWAEIAHSAFTPRPTARNSMPTISPSES